MKSMISFFKNLWEAIGEVIDKIFVVRCVNPACGSNDITITRVDSICMHGECNKCGTIVEIPTLINQGLIS